MAPAAAVDGRPATEPLSVSLYQEANRFRGYANLFTLLTLLGAIAIGYVTSQETNCDFVGLSPGCETTQDGATFALVTFSSFIGGILFVLPLRSSASVLTGVARLLESQEEAGPPSST